MFVPIFTSFGIENASLHSGRPRKLLPLISLSYFLFYFMTPVFQHGASLVYLNTKNAEITNDGLIMSKFNVMTA